MQKKMFHRVINFPVKLNHFLVLALVRFLKYSFVKWYWAIICFITVTLLEPLNRI